MKILKILLFVLFSNLLLINPILSQVDCSSALQFNLSQNGDDVQVRLNNLFPSADLCDVFAFSIDRVSYLDSDPNTAVTTIIVNNTLPIDAAGLYAYSDNDLSSGRHRYFATILMTDFTVYDIQSHEIIVAPSAYDMVWGDKVGVSQNGTRLTKTTHTGGYCNSGAASYNIIPSGEDGWVEMTVTENWRTKFFGVSNINLNACRWTIDYSVFFQGHKLHIYEGGQYKIYAANCVVGDVIRVERVGSTIYYKKNGVTFYTSYKPSYGSFIADVSIETQYGVIGDSRCSHPSPYGSLKVDNTDSENINIYPNPATSGSNLNIAFYFNSDETDTELNIYSINGQLVHKEVVNVQKGENTMSILLNDYAPGMYTMRLQAREYALTNKFIIR